MQNKNNKEFKKFKVYLKYHNIPFRKYHVRTKGKEEDWYVEDEKGRPITFHIDNRNFFEKNWLSITGIMFGLISLIFSIMAIKNN